VCAFLWLELESHCDVVGWCVIFTSFLRVALEEKRSEKAAVFFEVAVCLSVYMFSLSFLLNTVFSSS